MHTYGAVPSSATLTRISVPIQAISFTSLFLFCFIILFYLISILYYCFDIAYQKEG